MDEKLKELLGEISEIRSQKYTEEVERQKEAIRTALFDFLGGRKAAMAELTRATRTHQSAGGIWFEYTLDATILPEVIEFIKEKYNLEVDERDNRKVGGCYTA